MAVLSTDVLAERRQPFTHMMGRKASLALCFALSSCCCSAVATRLLVVKLQILQALRQGQFLLDGHAQQRVQGLLFILCSSQLPLHVIQLGHVLVAPETKRGGKGQTLKDIASSKRRCFAPAVPHFLLFPRLCFPDGRTSLLDSPSYYIRHFPACLVAFQRQNCIQNKRQYFHYLCFGQLLLQSNRCHGGNKPVILRNYTLLQTWLEERRT